MADRGITFSAAMVRALLEGRKTQTRRLIPNNRTADALFNSGFTDGYIMDEGNAKWRAQSVPHRPGDRLYVREHWRAAIGQDDVAPRDMRPGQPMLYLADSYATPGCYIVGRHRQAMHMPRWASRLTLLVTDVRVQRLQDISEADAIAEGAYRGKASGRIATNHTAMIMGDWHSTGRAWYRDLWDSLHTAPGTRWEDNPWIYAVSFDVRHRNIDRIGGDA